MATPRGHPKKYFDGLGGLEVKFGQIAPSLGDRKLHVLGWFGTVLDRFWLAQTAMMTKIEKCDFLNKKGAPWGPSRR